jgi:hypothetical protein
MKVLGRGGLTIPMEGLFECSERLDIEKRLLRRVEARGPIVRGVA